jgi:hypothetical protein
MATPIRLATYRELKDKLVGPVGSTKRTQFEQELAQELAILVAKPSQKPRRALPNGAFTCPLPTAYLLKGEEFLHLMCQISRIFLDF